MTDGEFVLQMNRLVKTYGQNAYPEERVKLIRKELGNLSVREFERVLDHLIADNDRPPMLPKFREMIAIVRERRWQEEKTIYRADAEQFMTALSLDEERNICRTITKRIKGEMDDTQWKSFNSVLKGMERKG